MIEFLIVVTVLGVIMAPGILITYWVVKHGKSKP